MSYAKVQAPYGSYYTFKRGERMSGLGACGCGSCGGCSGCGSCGGLRGLGDFEFNGNAAWSLWVQCSQVWQASQQVGPTCKEAVDSIRAGLMQLGYGSLDRGVSWGSSDQGAWKLFAAGQGIAGSGGMPTKGGLQIMDELLQQGKHPGPEKPIEMTKVGDEYVPAKNVESRAGLGVAIALGVIGVGVAGATYYYYAKKKKGRR